MKTIWITLLLIGIFSGSKGQSREVQQLLLNYEKLVQLKNILSDMKKGYEIVSKGYNAVKNIAEGNFNLHDAFISGLLKVNPAIKNYKRTVDIIKYQKRIVQEYKSAFKHFKASGIFDSKEIDYLDKVYSRLFKQSVQNLDELITVITSSKLSMSDNERLEAIDRIYEDTEELLLFLKDFNHKAAILAVQRTKEKQDIQTTRKLYQLN